MAGPRARSHAVRTMVKRARQIERATVPCAGAWIVLVVLLALVCGGRSATTLGMVDLLPVLAVARRLGSVAGLWSAALSAGANALCAAAQQGSYPLVAILAHAATFAVAGVACGTLADARRRELRRDAQWFEMSNALLVEASLDGYFTRLSAHWEQVLGWTREELMARPFREFIHPDDLTRTNLHADALELRPGEVSSFENRYQAKDGSWHWLVWSARSDSERKYAVARDVTERKRVEQERDELLVRLEALARTDALTGLPNRRAWDEELTRSVAAARRDGRGLVLAMIDLDHFKVLNDAQGHAAGDRFLCEAAAAWRLTLRVDDFLARYGGEEFAALLHGCTVGEAQELVERLRAATPGGTCSAGIAEWRGEAPEQLVARADAALYAAKRRGRDRAVCAPGRRGAWPERRSAPAG